MASTGDSTVCPTLSYRCGNFTFNDQHIHIDLFGGNGYGPGFGFRDERIYINGELRARAWQMGNSIGGGGMDHPAVALLRPDLGIRIVWQKAIVQLMMATEPGAKKGTKKALRLPRTSQFLPRQTQNARDLEDSYGHADCVLFPPCTRPRRWYRRRSRGKEETRCSKS